MSLTDRLHELLAAEARDRGIAAASVVERPLAEPISAWVPDLDREPRFLIYSITKTFTTVLILQLCGEGRLALYDPLARWFPDVPGSTRLTVEQLLNHTAGIRDYGGLTAYHADLRESPANPWSFDRFAAETFDRGLLFEPGTSFSYSNPGYMLLKGIAERVVGKPYRALIAERIGEPLGLRDTEVVETREELRPLAAGMSSELAPNGESHDVRTYYHPGWVSHGVIASTCSDVARFFDALFAGRIISRELVGNMLELIPLSLPDDKEDSSSLRPVSPGYGLGLMGDPDSPWGVLVGHNGGGPCYHASAFHAMRTGTSVCVMTAIERGFDTESIVAQTLDAVRNL